MFDDAGINSSERDTSYLTMLNLSDHLSKINESPVRINTDHLQISQQVCRHVRIQLVCNYVSKGI